jgi:hypothetical protein
VADDLRREARALVESRRRWRRHAVCARYRFVVGGLSHGEYVTASRGWVGGLVNLTMPPATTAGDQSRDRSRVVSFNPVVMPISRTLLYAPLLTEIPMPEREHSEAWLSPMPECSARQQRLRRWEAQEAVYAMRSSVYPCDAARHARRASTAGSATGWGAASARRSVSRKPQSWSSSPWLGSQSFGAMGPRMRSYHYVIATHLSSIPCLRAG